MTDTLETLRRKIDGATELESVVRTMKALAAASIVQYERAVQALDDYYRTVELGLSRGCAIPAWQSIRRWRSEIQGGGRCGGVRAPIRGWSASSTKCWRNSLRSLLVSNS